MSGVGDGEHPLEAISALADGELRRSERPAIEAHVASCASCRVLLEDLRRIADAIPEVAGPELPVGLDARVKARLRAEPAAPGRRRIVFPVAVAATLGALALLATVQFRQSRPLSEPRPVPEAASQLEERKSVSDDRTVPAESSNQATRRRDEKAGSPPESALRRVPLAPGDAAKEREADAVAGTAQTPAAASAPVLPPPPPPPPPPRPATDAERFAAAPPTEPPRSGKMKSEMTEIATASPDRGAVPGGVVGGVLGGVATETEELVIDTAVACSAPWEGPAEVAWNGTGTPDPEELLASLAGEAGGISTPGRDERGAFVTLRLPAVAWPRARERLRALGASVPAGTPALPEATPCVRLDVRLPSPARR